MKKIMMILPAVLLMALAGCSTSKTSATFPDGTVVTHEMTELFHSRSTGVEFDPTNHIYKASVDRKDDVSAEKVTAFSDLVAAAADMVVK